MRISALCFLPFLLFAGCNQKAALNDKQLLTQLIKDINEQNTGEPITVSINPANDTIKELNLSGKNLEILPVSVTGFKHLQELNLSGNNFDTLPDLTPLKQLSVLVLSGNRLTSIPDVTKLNQLKEIYLEINRNLNPVLTIDLPESIEVLRLDFCNTRHLQLQHPEKLKKLVEISFENDSITDFPESVYELPALERLRMRVNHLSNFKPEKLKTLKYITYTPSYLNNAAEVLQYMRQNDIEADTIWKLPQGGIVH